MITFLNSMFLVGLAATGVPVLLHLLHRRRRNLIHWGAMRFLLEAATRKTRLWRLSSLLLLLLRVLVVTLFVLALAQPMLRSRWFAPVGPRDVTLVLDCSMSTARVLHGRTIFQRQLQAARRVIDDLIEGDTVRILLATTVPEWLTPAAVRATPDVRAQLKRSLDDLSPTLASADLLRCVQAAIAAEPANGHAARVVAVLTDGQAYGWRAEAVESWQAVKAALESEDSPGALNVLRSGGEGT